MDFEVRKATKKDIEDIQHLSQILRRREHEEIDSTIIPNWPNTNAGIKYIRNRLSSKDSYVLLAYVDDRPVGFLIGTFSKTETFRTIPNFVELENMYVIRKYRKNGIGTKLIEMFIKWCDSKDAKRIRARTSPENKSGIEFYKKFGFLNYYIVMETEL